MRTFKTLTLLLLGLLIFGSAGYFSYQLFIKPGRLEKKEQAAAIAATPTPTPDPGAHELQRLKSLRTSGDSVGARVKGDSLAKIASKQKSNAELIQKANSLSGINLQIGQQLVIPSLKSSLELDRKTKNLTFLDNGIIVKEYSLLSSPQAPMKTMPAVNTKILDKSATS